MNTLLVREATPQQINAALLALSNSLGKSTEEVQQILATTSKIIELTKAEYEPIQQAGKWEKDAIYLVTDQSITGVVVDQHYSATSSNAQSGTAVAEAIADRVTQSQLSGALANYRPYKFTSVSGTTDAQGFIQTNLSITKIPLYCQFAQPIPNYSGHFTQFYAQDSGKYSIKFTYWDNSPIANANIGYVVIFYLDD